MLLIHQLFRSIALITVREAPHAAHNTENIVIDGIYIEVKRLTASFNSRVISQLKNSVINTRKVACSARLVFFGRKSERIRIDILTK